MKKFFSLMVCFCCLTLCFSGLLSACNAKTGDVSIKYYADGSQIVSAMLSGEENIGVVPEPAATNLVNKAKLQGKTYYRLDVQELYDSEKKSYPQAVLMIKESVLSTYPDIVNNIETKIIESVEFAKNDTSAAVEAIKSKLDTSTLNATSLSETAIDGCNIYFENVSDAKTAVKTYVDEITAFSATAAKSVVDDFFYDGSASGECIKKSLSFYVPDGAPALAIAKMIKENSTLGTSLTVNYNVIATTQVSTSLVPTYRSGNADIVILPVNLASKFYDTDDNSTDKYKMAGVVTHGNFYIVSTEKITVDDLKGKRVAVPQQNAVPDWTFRMVLNKHNLIGKNIEE